MCRTLMTYGINRTCMTLKMTYRMGNWAGPTWLWDGQDLHDYGTGRTCMSFWCSCKLSHCGFILHFILWSSISINSLKSNFILVLMKKFFIFFWILWTFWIFGNFWILFFFVNFWKLLDFFLLILGFSVILGFWGFFETFGNSLTGYTWPTYVLRQSWLAHDEELSKVWLTDWVTDRPDSREALASKDHY